jgi:para-nitrobenzyl esterase
MIEQPSVTTAVVESGVVAGLRDGQVRSFLGLPFAAPPFGDDRFAAPRPPSAWSGLRAAFRYGPTTPRSPYPAAARALFPEPVIPGPEGLNLDVHAPVGARDAPVLVWIHGGSFQTGSNAVPESDGTAFAREGIVCVVVNHRSGAEGFLELEDAPSNRGLLDVIAALRWVRGSIAAFGGDPARVTVAGESAGAAMVAALLATPSARGLYAAAAMPGGPYDVHLDRAGATAVAQALAARLGVAPTRAGFAAVAPEILVAAGDALAAEIAAHPDDWGRIGRHGRPFAPHADGELVAVDPPAAVAGCAVPVMLGTSTAARVGAQPPESAIRSWPGAWVRFVTEHDAGRPADEGGGEPSAPTSPTTTGRISPSPAFSASPAPGPTGATGPTGRTGRTGRGCGS